MKLSRANSKLHSAKENTRHHIEMKAVWYLILLCLIMIGLSGCNPKNKNEKYIPANSAEIAETAKKEINFLGVFKEMDSHSNTIVVFDVQNNIDIKLSFHGGTDVKDQYDQIISMAQIEVGELVDITYYPENSKIKSLLISKEAWEYKKVDNLVVDTTDSILQIGEKKYQYSKFLLIASDEKFVSLIDINTKDELTVKGVGGKIYSIIVTKGHGYIRLKDYEAFVGGIVSVGYTIFLPISEDMLIVAREGDYKITLENGELTGSKMVNVVRNQEATIEMGEYHIEAERVGAVEFHIAPEGADLYINGTLTEYSEDVKLNYGEHEVQVKLSGYSTYTGLLTIAQASQTINIDLADPSATTVDESTETDTSTTDLTQAEEATETAETTETKTDTLHKIYVEAPAGATVYLNGTAKGTVPANFTKEIGTFTISLSKEGYVTKSYTVVVEDDSSDIYFSFPEMTATQ